MSHSAIAVLVLLGWAASATAAVLLWNRRRVLRLLPILYGVCVGVFIVANFDHMASRILADLVAGLVLGGIVWFAIWTEVRYGR